MKNLIGVCLLLIIAIVESRPTQDVYADIYALRMSTPNNISSLISLELDDSSYKTLTSYSSFASQFSDYHNISFYDSLSETFIIGNSNPPTLLLTNTFTGVSQVAELPLYGSLLAVTSYEGVVYALLGLDEDLPNLGSILSYDIETGQIVRLVKFKIDENQSFLVGSTLTWLPITQTWIFDVKEATGNTTLYTVTDTNPAILRSTQLPGGYQSLWYDVNTNSSIVFGYLKGKVYQINLVNYSSTLMLTYQCPGILSVDFQKREFYHLSSCDTPIIEIYSWYYNKSSTPVDLDPDLADIASIQSVGAYIPYKCGMQCLVNTDCLGAKTCNTCRDGACTSSGDCGAFCLNAGDCYAGVCVTNCDFNRCGKRGCGTSCKNHDDCILNSRTCQVCRLGKCVSTGDCGAYCLTQQDCYAGACSNMCVDFICSTGQ